MSGKSSTEEPSDKLAETVHLIERRNKLCGAGKCPDAEIHCKTSGINSHDYSETLFHFTDFYVRQERFADAVAV
jgi:UDP-galactopyranose mutase